MADSVGSENKLLENVIQEVLESLKLIQGAQANDSLLREKIKSEEVKKKVLSYLVEINQLIEQIEAFIERIGILGNARGMFVADQVKPKQILKNLTDIRDQLEVLLSFLDEAKYFADDCISCLCQMLIEGIQIPKFEQFNISAISNLSPFKVIGDGGMRILTSEQHHELTSFMQGNAVIRTLIYAFSACFIWVANIETIVLVGMGAGGIFLKAVSDEISKGLENNEVFYEELGKLEAEIFRCGIKAKLTTLLSAYEKQSTNRKDANLIILVRNSYNQVLASIKGSKSLEESTEKSELQILEEMSGNPSFNGLVDPVAQNLKCSIEMAWNVMREIFTRQC